MINSKSLNDRDDTHGRNAAAALRRDAAFIWHAVIVIVFVCFAGLAVAATVIDLVVLPH